MGCGRDQFPYLYRMDLLLLAALGLPWVLVALFLAVAVRLPPPLAPPLPESAPRLPRVSVIVPARNEEENLPTLLASLTTLDYPAFEILVVDDESRDRTRDVVLSTPNGRARALRLIRGRPLPQGWLGKPWACHQGSREARGDLLLFTDADTRHDPDLLERTVRTLLEEEGDALTLAGRQVMGSFWERLLQPQFFVLLAFRFPRAGTPKPAERWKNAIANGQYLLFRRESYEDLGGHTAVKGEVVEDMRLAQILTREGKRLLVRRGTGLRTRMYRSLGGLVEGWSKNITIGARQAFPGLLRPVILPLSLVLGFLLWLLPPLVLGWALAGGDGGLALSFGAFATGFGVVFWGLAAGVMGANPLYGLLYPLGSILLAYIFLRSWVRGNRVQWKERSYTVSSGNGPENGESPGGRKGMT